MKVIHLSTSDINGGAARGAYRLHIGLKMLNVDSEMFVKEKYSNSDSVLKYRYPLGIRKFDYKLYRTLIERDFKKYFFSRPIGLEAFSDDRSPNKIGFFSQLPEADIYNLHWTSSFVDLSEFFSRIEKPIVWTLHDMFPFTGGCHYNVNCERYKIHCYRCPQLGSSMDKDLSWHIWERKFNALTNLKSKIVIRADSNWLADEAKESRLFKDLDIAAIHYGIETDEFFPRDKQSCRNALNIPPNKKVIVFGAPAIDNPRKGFIELLEAIRLLGKSDPNLFLLSFGSGTMTSKLEIPFLHLDHVNNNHLLSVIYNCADVFVIPSLQEAFGQTALEAMSCGIPVVGFKTGGIPDMVENNITGYLVEQKNSVKLAEAISWILKMEDPSHSEMSKNCREKVLNSFKLSDQAENYIKAYSELLI